MGDVPVDGILDRVVGSEPDNAVELENIVVPVELMIGVFYNIGIYFTPFALGIRT